MASNGLENKAVKGKCRICQRVRFTEKGQPINPQVKPVGEVRHGFATGYIWECIDIDSCDSAAQNNLSKSNFSKKDLINNAIEEGRYKSYKIFS